MLDLSVVLPYSCILLPEFSFESPGPRPHLRAVQKLLLGSHCPPSCALNLVLKILSPPSPARTLPAS